MVGTELELPEELIYEVRGPAAWITFNRPDKLNAFTDPMIAGLYRAFDQATHDDEIKVVVLTGAGRSFSAGFDLGREAARTTEGAHDWYDAFVTDSRLAMTLWALPKPTIAAVRGHCLGGACELAMACDMVVSTTSASFGIPEIRYGSGPLTLLMPFILGEKKTKELLLTGDTIDAASAERFGLINRVVADEDLDGEVTTLIRKVAPTPLAVLRLTKTSLISAYEAMGLRQAVSTNLALSAMLSAADTPEQRDFMRLVESEGLKAALIWRDSRYDDVL